MANYGTGITIECLCGATGVPVKWGTDQTGWGMKARVHAEGVPFTQNYTGATKCLGPADVFINMLRQSKLAVSGNGKRIMTLSEQRAMDVELEPGEVLVCPMEDMGLANG